jgi:pilus assembly protein CpaC
MKINTFNLWLKKVLHISAVAIFVIQHSLALAVTQNDVKTIYLNPNFGSPLKLPEDAATIAIGDPNLIDIVTVQPNMLMITGQVIGATSLTVFGKSGAIYHYRIQITRDVTQLKNLIQSIEPRVVVSDINGKVMLTGEVDTPAALVRVLTIADRFVGGNVANQPDFKVISDYGGILAGNLDETISTLDPALFQPLALGGGGGVGNGGGNGGGRGGGGLPNNRVLDEKANLAQNISRASVVSVANGKVLSMIKVNTQPKVEIQMRIVEIDRSKTDLFGIDWRLDGSKVSVGSRVGKVVNTLPGPNDLSDGAGINTGSSNLVGIFTPGKYFLSTFVNILETKGAVSTLSEPLLTAVSGESARFLVGGSVPILSQVLAAGNATSNAQTATNVVFIQFGLQITVRPTVLENGKISIVLDQSISEPDYTNAIQAIGATVPGFKQKAVSTVTESESGETWAVAGLLTEEDRKSLESVPWISKVPILGKIFEKKDDSTSRNELIILVNARRVDTPNTTTTNFETKGKLAPSGNSDNQTDSLDTDNTNSELNTQSAVPLNKIEPSESNKVEQKPINLNKNLKDKNNPVTPNTKTKKVAVTGNDSSRNKNGAEDAIKFINLKEKKLVNNQEVMSEKKDSATVATQDVAQTFSFDTEKLIKDIIEKKPSAQVENQKPLALSQPAPNVDQTNVTFQDSKIAGAVTPQNKLQNEELGLDTFKNKKSTINPVDSSFTSAPRVNYMNNSDVKEVQAYNLSKADQPLSSSKDRVFTSTDKEIAQDVISPQDVLAITHVEEKKTTEVKPKEPVKKHALSADTKQVSVVIINFLSSEDKNAYFQHALNNGMTNVPPKSEWSKWRVAMGAVNGNAKKLIKFAVSPDMRKQVYSGASAYIQVPRNQFNYAAE